MAEKQKIKIRVKKKIKITVKQQTITTDETKQRIIQLFYDNVKGKEILLKKSHCGSEGQWLEQQMGVKSNSKNAPDVDGYELKKESPKITFGDFSASEYLFKQQKPLIDQFNEWETGLVDITRDDFMHYFGAPNPKKHGRYSWSGQCVPTYGQWNTFGQVMKFNDNNDLCIYYSFDRDTRPIKTKFPVFLKETNEVLIAIWTFDKLSHHINNKFNQKGFFVCKKIGGKYEKICFGPPFNFSYFIKNMKNGLIIFDSGMYTGNTRNYSQFRSSSKVWDSMITEEY